MSIDLKALREEFEVHKDTLQEHTKDNILGVYSSMFGVDAYVLRVNDYKNSVDQLELILNLFDSNIFEEAFKGLNIKVDTNELKRKNLSNPKIIDMSADILKKLKDHKIFLDKINITITV